MSHSPWIECRSRRRSGRRLRLLGLAALATAAALTALPGVVAPAGAAPLNTNVINATSGLPAPLTTAQCRATFGINCYTPIQYHAAYDLNPLYGGGITGAGRTIVIVDSFGSPTIVNDLHTFDAQFGLPDPPSLTIDKFGTIPPFDPGNSVMVGWAVETSLDVEYAHAIAPGANIVLAVTPVAETEGVDGLPQMMAAEKKLIDAGVPDVISQSFGATENTFPGFGQGNFSSLLGLRFAFEDAAAHNVTVLAGSGDEGTTNDELDLATLYPFRVNSWPSSDPLVTSLGGSMLTLSDNGTRLAPDTVWNDGFGASGGGLSAIFSRPAFQNGVQGVVGGSRGTPDISMSAAVNGGAWVFWSFRPGDPGWNIVGGTSEATPIFAGIVALADQVAGHRLGDINPALYSLGAAAEPASTGIVDITTGNNRFHDVPGFDALAGYDLASGWGTIDANAFVHALASH
jgi:subtilase family serine protease